MRPTRWLITCEHGGKRVPAAWRPLFEGHADLLDSHRGHDPGALLLAREMARALDAPLHYSTVSRLVIDLNRSIGHPRLYSEATRPAPKAMRAAILRSHYLPYRGRIEKEIAEAIADGRRVLHIASHSFTPVLDGEIRNTDVGLLYDPGRGRGEAFSEKAICRAWQAALQAQRPDLRVRMNYPYTGRSDGLTAYLRRRFAAADYVGIELEVNQRFALADGRPWREARRGLLMSLRALAETLAAS